MSSPKKNLSYAASLRLDAVRADSIDVAALLDNRKVYGLSPVRKMASRGGGSRNGTTKRGFGSSSKPTTGEGSRPLTTVGGGEETLGDKTEVVANDKNNDTDAAATATTSTTTHSSNYTTINQNPAMKETISKQNIHYDKPKTLAPELVE